MREFIIFLNSRMIIGRRVRAYRIRAALFYAVQSFRINSDGGKVYVNDDGTFASFTNPNGITIDILDAEAHL